MSKQANTVLVECPKCHGQGVVRGMFSSKESTCKICHGTGLLEKKEYLKKMDLLDQK